LNEMETKGSPEHSSGFLFPLLIFCIFTLSAAAVILFSARVYRRTVTRSEDDFRARTAVSYVTEKIRRSAGADAVTVGEFDTQPALILTAEHGSAVFSTCIYASDGYLREFTALEGTTGTAASGTQILPMEAFTPAQLSDSLVQITCTDTSGETDQAVICLRAAG